MPMTVVAVTIVTVVIVARSGSVAALIARRMPIVAASVGHALVTCWSAVVLAIRDVPARTAVGVAATCRSTACSLTTAATGVIASATAFGNECQKTRTRMELIRNSTRKGRPGR